MLIDLHTHTKPLSEDSFITPAELIQQAKQNGLDAICLTEHDWFWDREALEKLVREHDFPVFPGVEINTEDGHFLVFGLDEYIFGMHRTEYLRRIVDEVGGFMILAHPFRRNLRSDDNLDDAVERYCRKPVCRFLDTIEVLNGRAAGRQNRFSQELCRRLNMKDTAGSDAHSLTDIPSFATRFERKINNVEELITELRAGRFRPVDLRPTS